MWKRFLCCRKKVKKNVLEDISVMVTNDFITSIGLLGRIEWKDTIPFIPPVDKGLVIKVYDGDTITIAAKLPSFLNLIWYNRGIYLANTLFV